MTQFAQWLVLLISILTVPPLCAGTLRKTKARLQNRIGPPLYQPYLDYWKLFHKQEVISTTTTGVFRFSAMFSLATMLTLNWLVPWTVIRPWAPTADLFLILYMLATAKFFTLLGAADCSSSFGSFAVGREATLNFLSEPVFALALASLALSCGSSDLRSVFSFSNQTTEPAVFFFAGFAILLAGLVELSRMPIEDPTTHLELTMIHEALIIEASGKNLLAIELAQVLKFTLFFGLSAQCFMHAVPAILAMPSYAAQIIVVILILILTAGCGVMESLIVRLQWRKIPEFIAYGVTLSLVCAFLSVMGKTHL